MTPGQATLHFAPVGDKAVTAVFGDTIDPAINRRIRHTVQALQSEVGQTIEEMVPTYSSILVIYDPLQKSYADICEMITQAAEDVGHTTEAGTVRVVEIPTVYGGEYGMDMEFVAEHAGLTADEVIQIHSVPTIWYICWDLFRALRISAGWMNELPHRVLRHRVP